MKPSTSVLANFICATCFAVIPEGIFAQNLTGNDLLEACQSDAGAQQGFCIGYIKGVIEGMKWGAAAPFFAAGETSTTKIEAESAQMLRFCQPCSATIKMRVARQSG